MLCERKAMIDRNHELPITRQVEVLGISRGAIYYVPRPISVAELALMRRIDCLHLEYPFMGARMLRRELSKEGIDVGRRHLGTLMRRMNIHALARSPAPAKPALGTRSTRTCCATQRSSAPIRCGRSTQPPPSQGQAFASRWRKASCI